MAAWSKGSGSVRFLLQVGALAGLLGAAVAAGACGAVDEPLYGPPGGIDGRKPPPPAGFGDTAGTTGATTGGTTGAAACVQANFVSDPNCAVKWSTDIYPKVKAAWACTGCHGTQAPIIDGADATKAWDQLRATAAPISGGKPYVNPCSKDPTASSFVGNVKHEVGKGMPTTAPLGAADVDQLTTWVACGAPNN